MPEGVKYCPQCGTPSIDATRQGKTKYEGEIHKCPNCGEVLGAFVAICPSCGYELRGTSASSVVSSFAKKIEEIERGDPSGGKKMSRRERDKQTESLIRNFVIPNTKEELLEFLILASSHIDIRRYDIYQRVPETKKAVSDAWEVMFDQAYKKAQSTFVNSPDFTPLSTIYEDTKRRISQTQKKSRAKLLLHVFLCIGLFALVLILLHYSPELVKS